MSILLKMNIVHIMKKAITTKEKILENAKKEARRKGLEKIGMREISSASSVALGTLYNYFPDKESLIIATISSIWNETIGNLKKPEGFVSALSVFMMLTRGTLEVIGLPLSSALDVSIFRDSRNRSYSIVNRTYIVIDVTAEGKSEIKLDLSNNSFYHQSLSILIFHIYCP